MTTMTPNKRILVFLWDIAALLSSTKGFFPLNIGQEEEGARPVVRFLPLVPSDRGHVVVATSAAAVIRIPGGGKLLKIFKFMANVFLSPHVWAPVVRGPLVQVWEHAGAVAVRVLKK